MNKVEIFMLILVALAGIAFSVHAQLNYNKHGHVPKKISNEFRKKLIPKEKFIRILKTIPIRDPEVKTVWESMCEAAGNENEAYPELILEMLTSLTNQSALTGFNEFWIDDDCHSNESNKEEDKVCLGFRMTKTYCSKTKLIAAYTKLLEALKKEGIHSWVIWNGDSSSEEYTERVF